MHVPNSYFLNMKRIIHRPWRKGIIVKLLGRKFGYKALETRLKQMWIKKGVINIIDLSNDYFLVIFSHDEDHSIILANGPWFIYDHYLTVKGWSPDFHPISDTIENVAVWVRIFGLLIEYYDMKVLSFIGNIIAKTTKVDKNILTHERGKYVRLCVKVNLSKPLLAILTIKERRYKIEYEWIHLLYTMYGRLGHYKEGCPKRNMEKIDPKLNEAGKAQGMEGQSNKIQTGADGPWSVVHKSRRPRKVGGSAGNNRKTQVVGDSGGNRNGKTLVKVNA